MPENRRAIRRKIRAVGSIGQITRAMKMVAAARLQKVQARVESGRVYSSRLQGLLAHAAAAAGAGYSHPYLEQRAEPQSVGLLLVAGDKGLCGSHNANLFRVAGEFLGAQHLPVRVVTVASKAAGYAARMELDVLRGFEAVTGADAVRIATEVARECRSLYETGTVDTLWVVCTEFQSIVRRTPVARRLLPISGELAMEQVGGDIIFEPPADVLLASLLPQAIESQIVQILLEADAAEQAARMTAMSAATDSADEMIRTLNRQLNRARQYAITREMLDIIGGAGAVGG